MILRIALVLWLSGLACGVARAQESTTPDREPIFDIGQIEVPEGSVSDLLEFLEQMSQLQGDLASDYRTAMTKISAAQAKASSGILANADDLSDEQFAKAANFGLAARVREIAQASEEEQRKLLGLVKRQLSIGVEKGLQPSELSNASMLAGYLERYGDGVLAAEAYRSFADLLKEAKNPAHRAYAERFEGPARRLALLGNPIELSGKLLDGTDFDWESYRGKVVLVDFWATWCGPCLAEAPNVRKQYELYHDLGFDVVGISLDSDKSALEAYVQKENVPWANLFQAGAGWKHPMATKYGVNAIPTVFLVDRDGRVVSLRARGPELGAQLRKLFDTKADWERAIALYSERIESDRTDARLFAQRASAYAATEQWDLARSDWLQATELQASLCKEAFDLYRSTDRWSEASEFGLKWVDENPADGLRWLMVAAVLAFDGDDQALREHCQGMAKQFANTDDPRDARLTIKACLLRPELIESEQLPVERLIKTTDQGGSAWDWSIRAMLAYRQGDARTAVESVAKSDQLRPVDFARAANLPVLAMAQHELGDEAAARRALDEASQLLESLEANEANRGHNDLMIGQILLREATQTINGETN